MKVENHDAKKSRKRTRKYFKKGNTKNVNKYQTLFNNVRVIVLVFPHSTVIVCILCVFTNYKLLKILMFAHRRHKKKIIRMQSILFYIRIHSY